MKLSIIIPTHNTRALVENCVRSVLAHAGEAEILVVDDASEDGTAPALANLAAPDSSVRVLRLDRRCGFARAANHGLERATGDLLLLLNSDAQLTDGARRAIESAFVAHPRLGILGASLLYPGGSWQWSGGREPGFLWFLVFASGLGGPLGALRRAFAGNEGADRPSAAPELRTVDWVSGAAMSLRRQTLADCGALDESFAFYAQDLDYCCRAAQAGWQIAVARDFRVLHLHGATVGGADPPEEGKEGFQRLDYLWCDLLLWYRRRHGAARAARARQALLVAGTLRLALTRRPSERTALRAALATLGRQHRGVAVH
jgi:N-acetylglucosaminyl-diphospho-decaprenol L-rhamnosyltransferase